MRSRASSSRDQAPPPGRRAAGTVPRLGAALPAHATCAMFATLPAHATCAMFATLPAHATFATLAAFVALAAVAALAAPLALTGCGPTLARPPARVAIVPVDTVGVPATEGTALESALLSALDRSRAARAVPGAATAAAAAAAATQPADWTRCRESSACLASVGRRVPADLVLSLAVAGLGDLRLVRSRLLRTDDGLALQDLQETVQGGRPALEAYAVSLARRLFPESARRPWYRQWWFFVAVAGVAGATAAATWAIVRSQRHDTGVIHIGDL